MWISHRKEMPALRRSESRNCGLCVVYIEKCGATLLVGAWQREKQQNKLVERKPFVDENRSLIPWGLRVPIWKINFCSRVLRLSVLPWCRERPQTVICCIEWFGRLKCLATGLDAFLSSFSTSRRCSRNRYAAGRLVVYLFRRYVTFCKECKLYNRWHWLRYR